MHEARPLWREIEATLREEIAGGRYRPGEKLPTEAAFAIRFDVNRHTVRRALAALADGGLTHARRGAGVFIAAKPVAYPVGDRVRFHENLEAAGRAGRKETLRLETIAAAKREATALDVKVGAPVHVWEGVAYADDVPVCLFHTFFPAERTPGFHAAITATGSVTAALAADGITDFKRASTDITAELAGTMHARHLQLRADAPLIFSVGINVDADRRPVEYGRSWFAGERIVLQLPHRRT